MLYYLSNINMREHEIQIIKLNYFLSILRAETRAFGTGCLNGNLLLVRRLNSLTILREKDTIRDFQTLITMLYMYLRF